MKLSLKYNEWTQLPYTEGTIENVNTQATIEVNSTGTAGGIVLYPTQRLRFDEQLYARSLWDNDGVVANVVDFAESGGGGGGGGEGSAGVEIVQAVIPTTGWVANDDEDYPLKVTIANEAFTADKLASVTVSTENQDVANECGLSSVCETGAGGLTLYAVKAPSAEIPINVNLWAVV